MTTTNDHRHEDVDAEAKRRKREQQQLLASRKDNHLRQNLVNETFVVHGGKGGGRKQSSKSSRTSTSTAATTTSTSFEDEYEIVKQLGVGSMGSVCIVKRKHKSKITPALRSSTSTMTTTAVSVGSSSRTNNNNKIRGGGSSLQTRSEQEGSNVRDKYLAMKTLKLGRLTKEYQKDLDREIHITSNLDHPHIVNFQNVYRQGLGRFQRVYVVMDYCSGGDLYGKQPYTEKQAAFIMKQVLSAVAYMHSRNYTHRDLKVNTHMPIVSNSNFPCDPTLSHGILAHFVFYFQFQHQHQTNGLYQKFENIMFESKDSYQVKIIDFGLSARFQKGEPLSHQVGTVQTMAPEVFTGKYNSSADLWSCGVISYELICGIKPWKNHTALKLIQEVCQGQYTFRDYKRTPRWKTASDTSKGFVRKLVRKTAENRPTALQALEHPWIVTNTSHNTTGSSISNQSGSSSMNSQQSKSKLLAYAKMPHLQKVATLLVAHYQQAFPEEIEELRNAFEEYDQDKTGVISLNEFQEAFAKNRRPGSEEQLGSDNDDGQITALSSSKHASSNSGTTGSSTNSSSRSSVVDNQEWKEIFEGIDTYHDERISYTEFLAASMTVFGFVTEEQIVDAFEKLDADGTGCITMDNLRVMLGRDFTEESATRMIQELDIKLDGVISLEEFLMAFRKFETKTLSIEEEEEEADDDDHHHVDTVNANVVENTTPTKTQNGG